VGITKVPGGHVEQGILSRKGRRWKALRVLDISVLLYHVYQGLKNPEVGFEDAEETLNSLSKRLNYKFLVDPKILESCLWSCNLLNEQGKWWHPKDRTFDEFLKDVLGEDSFNKTYNCIVKKGDT
jgi:hypothetical protein